MKRYFLLVIVFLSAFFIACSGSGGSSSDDDDHEDDQDDDQEEVYDATESSGFDDASDPGDSGVLTLLDSSETQNMIYSNNQTSITFPTEIGDAGAVTLDTPFFLGETEVTNAFAAAVFQWAYDEGYFSDTVDDHNGVDSSRIKYGGKTLVYLDGTQARINYDEAGSFSVDSGYDDHPVTNISWYGAVMICNWLTEMRDGDTDNAVYTGITSDWEDDDTVEDVTQSGYRLPGTDEWEFAARFLGTTEPSEGSLASEFVGMNINGGDGSLTDGYYWTPGDYPSGSSEDYNDVASCREVAVYSGSIPDPTEAAVVNSLGNDGKNTLGLSDMSGNVWEWCFTADGGDRYARGAGWECSDTYLQVGLYNGTYNREPYYTDREFGFRLCRSR